MIDLNNSFIMAYGYQLLSGDDDTRCFRMESVYPASTVAPLCMYTSLTSVKAVYDGKANGIWNWCGDSLYFMNIGVSSAIARLT